MRNIFQDTLGNIMLFSAAWILAGKMPRKSHFLVRSVLCFAGLCALRYLYFDVVLGVIIGDDWRLAQMLGFVGLFFLVAVAVGLCFECDFWAALFCGSTSYCLQHVCQRTYLILHRFLPEQTEEIAYVFLYTSIMLCCLVILWSLLKYLRIDKIVVNNRMLLIASLLVIASSVVLDLLLGKGQRGDALLLRTCINLSSAMICTLIFTLQLGMVTSKRREIELDAIKALLEEERRQYYFEKSMIEMVNIKCHDLKHQIAALDKDGQKKLREDIKPIIDAYDSSFRTGNVALDVVLTRENFNCREKNVKLTCVANGACLNFMSEVDVYSLFGNILDNAIEATEKLEDPEKRIISLSVAQEGYFVSIHAENYFGGRLTFTDDLPETSKPDTVYHGYGLKSIRMLVQKYDGSLKISTHEDRFILDILFSI